jgi:sugar phosphate isomerase/epimerase
MPRKSPSFVSRLAAGMLAGLLAPLVAAAAASGPGFPGPVGLQLYSLREQFAKDVPGTLDLVRAFGFREVELAGTYGLTPAQFRAELDARGLRAVSAHVPFEQLRDDIDGVVRDAQALGLREVGCAWVPHQDPFDEKTCREAIAVFNRAGAVLAAHRLRFFWHLHGYEFQPHGAGTLVDLIMAETDPHSVSFEMDVFWLVHAGQGPLALLQRYRGRWLLLHLKGMKDTTPTGLLTGHSEITNSVPLGTGKIDYRPVLRAAQAAGVQAYFIEDESPRSAQQIPPSLRYLATLEW